MAQAARAARVARALWPGRCSLVERLGGRPWPQLLAQSRAGFAGAAGGQGPAAAVRKGSPRLLRVAVLALGGALGLYHTARWHLRAQHLRAHHSAAQVRSGRAVDGGCLQPTPNSGLLGSRGVRCRCLLACS
jgi:microsomal prostaglandin-E synthase 2